MVKITEELLRKRAEHNDGQLSNLEEITLHQYEIEKIELVGTKCRALKILYLQQNLIEKIENLQHLKDLRTLNLAGNLVQEIAGLESCEKLESLDLTYNYVQDLLSIRKLKKNHNLRKLVLMGNPCANYPGYRLFVIGTLPQLKQLDSVEIVKSERIQAEQQWESIEANLIKSQEAYIEKKRKEAASGPKYNEKGERLYGNDPESRKAAAKEMRDTIDESGYNEDRSVDGSKIGELDRVGSTTTKYKRGTPAEDIEKYGKIMQCNDGKWKFNKYEDGQGNLVLDVPAGKFMPSNKIDIDLQPTYIAIKINKKELRLRFEKAVEPDKAKAERSSVTGNLKLTMPLVQKNKRGETQLNRDDIEKENAKPAPPVSHVKPKPSTSLKDGDIGHSFASIVN